ncbi:Rieske (2Fe-2S) protein [Streptomyces sp. NPDC006552]|uniref:Rieske (2Fe-2S) protein n=1 Tax=Streptomyces sp. NPDC006552 TaxID=3157179 RepID=UPI0033A4915C
MTAAQESVSPGAAPARRTVVAAVGAAGLAAALSACGDEKGGGAEPAGKAASARAGRSELARTSDIPEGGGKVFADAGVVVTQPKKGEFKCFTTTCTHAGCAVTEVAEGTIDCPCHGSRFSIEDGSVTNPPATRPLPEKKITVSGDSISLA